MTQFNVNGRLLDLPADGVNLQFKKSNPLFAFDSLECERSTSFDVPATPNNDVIFGLAKVINGTGAGMRVRYATQLQADGVVKDGYLYVTSFSGGKYKCVFVTGELLGLQRLKDAGKVKEICTLTDTYTYGGTGTPAILKSSPFAPVAYLNENTGDNPPHISLRLRSVLTNCMSVLGVPVTWPQGGWEYVRIIPSEMHGLTESAQHFYRVGVGSMSDNDNPQVSKVSFTGLGWLFDTALASVACLIQDTQTTTLYHGRLQQLVPRQNITISFPADFPSDVFVGRFVDGGTTNASECQFYGDYAFDDSGTITGDPLAGRTITIPANSEFVFLRGGDYMNGEESGGAHVRGWFYGLVPTQIDENVTLKGEVSATLPPYNVVSIVDNLPDCTVVELLKVVAAMTGTVLNYDDKNGVTFSDLDCSTWNAKDLTGKVIETSDLTRTFGDYAQQNDVVFDSSDKVLQIERIGQKYTVQNENIEAEKELQKIPFDEGGSYGNLLFVRDADGYDKDVIADADTNQTKMIRVHLPKCNGLQALCTVSTAVKLKVRMSLFEFDRLTAQTLLYSNNAFWVWNSAQWSKNVATFAVSKTNTAKVAPTIPVEYLEFIDKFHPDFHIKLSRTLGENFELRFTWDLRDRSSQFHYLFLSDSQTHEPQTLNGNIPSVEAIGILNHYQFTYFRDYRLDESTPVHSTSMRMGESSYAQNGGTWEMRWRNNLITAVYPETSGVSSQERPSWGSPYTDVQSGFGINEFWFAAQSGISYIPMISTSTYYMKLRKVEAYDNGVLIETFRPAIANGREGLYSDTQGILYPTMPEVLGSGFGLGFGMETPEESEESTAAPDER